MLEDRPGPYLVSAPNRDVDHKVDLVSTPVVIPPESTILRLEHQEILSEINHVLNHSQFKCDGLFMKQARRARDLLTSSLDNNLTIGELMLSLLQDGTLQCISSSTVDYFVMLIKELAANYATTFEDSLVAVNDPDPIANLFPELPRTMTMSKKRKRKDEEEEDLFSRISSLEELETNGNEYETRKGKNNGDEKKDSEENTTEHIAGGGFEPPTSGL